MRETYEAFLESKIAVAKETGFDVEKSEINSALMPHQRDTVLWALRGGRRAVFCKFGLGKTVIGLEFAHQVVKHEGGKALIVLPLGVKQEFTHDATELLKYEKPEYIRSMDEANESKSEILLTNYERVRDGDVDPKQFTATVLDEAAVLRSFGSKTYQTFLDKFKGVKYKLVATATPDPNKYKELIHYAGYLEIMDTGQALTRFFQRNSTQANDLTIYPHKEREFWLWVSSWALCFTKPSDLCSAYSDEGYVLPKLEIRKHKIASDSVTIESVYNAKDRDGKVLLNGDIKYFRDGCNGYLYRGKIYHNINNMWWVIVDKRNVRNVASFQLFDLSESDCLRRKAPDRTPKEYLTKRDYISKATTKELIAELRRRSNGRVLEQQNL